MYSYTPKNNKRFARAYVRGVNASYKDLCAVCDSIRGRNAASAIDFLASAAQGEKAIRYRTHNAGMGHRKELGGGKGGYPKKAAGIMLKLLQSAYANANAKGIANVKVTHAAANKGDVIPRMSPKGKRMRMDYETAHAQVVLEEISIPDWSKPRSKGNAQKAPAAKAQKPKKEQKPAVAQTQKAQAEKPANAQAEKATTPNAPAQAQTTAANETATTETTIASLPASMLPSSISSSTSTNCIFESTVTPSIIIFFICEPMKSR